MANVCLNDGVRAAREGSGVNEEEKRATAPYFSVKRLRVQRALC